MAVLDLAEHHPAWLVDHACGDLDQCRIVPECDRRREIDPVLAQILGALVRVELEFHVRSASARKGN